MQCLHKNREEKSDFLIFALENSKELGRKIAEKLKTNLSEIFVRRFADKEIYVKIETSVRGKNVFLIKSTSPPVNENLIELLITIDALKRGSAKSINLVLPYYGYSRQDRKEGGREAITGKLVANLLVRAGITRLLTFELHAPQIQGFFDIPVDDLRATQDLLTCFLEKNEKKEKKIDLKEIVVVTPDVGGIKRAIR
jgi:ribose-phosphate pyrophosphokinase